MCAITFLLRTTRQNKNLKLLNGGTEADHTAGQIFGTIDTRYLRTSRRQIHQIDRKFIERTPAQNDGKIISKFRGGGPGGDPTKQLNERCKVKKLPKYFGFFLLKS